MRLANKLQDIGFGVERKRDDFEISGIKPDVLKRFSRRTGLIEKLAEELGITDPDRKAELGAESREKKGSALSWDSLRKEWAARLTDPERKTLAAVHRRETKPARAMHREAMAIDHALDHSFVRDAVLPERKLVTVALQRGLGSVTVEETAREMRSRPLIRSDVAGRAMATTKEMLVLESKLIDFARQGRGRSRPLGNPERACSRDWFNEGQKSVKASREVLREEAGFANADTVARFLKDQEMQETARNGVILVDEASQLGTRDMLKVFDVAEAVSARVILVGDRRQHRSVTAGEPLKLLEESAGLKVAEVTEILRQQGNYKKAAKALSEGRTEDAFCELDKLGWIKEVDDVDRNQQLATAYLSASAEKKRGGKLKTALVVSPTHIEAEKITQAIRAGLKSQEKLGEERIVNGWIPSHLTDAQKADATEYESGYLLQFQQNAKGFKKGSRLVLGEGVKPPTELANRFELYRPTQFALAKGDRVRVTASGKTRDGKHKLSNGSLLTVQGFTGRGDIVVDHGWVIDRDFGHLTHGYVVTSHASQGVTVDKVFVGISSESFPATGQRTAYVAVTRGKEQVTIFTDDRTELLKAITRPDEPMSATELSQSVVEKPSLRDHLAKRLAFARHLGVFAARNDSMHPTNAREGMQHRETDNAR